MENTDLTLADLNGIRGFWQKHLCAPCVIAGGAVRDVLMGNEPKDVDIFVLGDIDQDVIDDSLIDMVMEGAICPEVTEGDYEGEFVVGTFSAKGYQIRHQVMMTGHSSLNHLLDSFDWNVCLFGIDIDGEAVARVDLAEVGPGQKLKLQTLTHPFSTWSRGMRFAARYDMVIDGKAEHQIKKAIQAAAAAKESI